jgi:hypothetical protein
LVHIYVDESGDLGFSERSSNYFILCYIITDHHERIKIEVKRLLKCINRHSKSKIIEFKFSRDKDLNIYKLLNLISTLNVDIGVISIKKSAVKRELRDKKPILYNYIIGEYVVRTILSEYGHVSHIGIHLDLSMSKSSREHFDQYFSYKVETLSNTLKISNHITNQVFHDHSHDEPCIQIADYAAGSLRKLHENADSRYYEMIKNKILHSHEWGINK